MSTTWFSSILSRGDHRMVHVEPWVTNPLWTLTEGAKLAGLYAGNPKRKTNRPAAERLLEAFQDITLTIIKGP